MHRACLEMPKPQRLDSPHFPTEGWANLVTSSQASTPASSRALFAQQWPQPSRSVEGKTAGDGEQEEEEEDDDENVSETVRRARRAMRLADSSPSDSPVGSPLSGANDDDGDDDGKREKNEKKGEDDDENKEEEEDVEEEDHDREIQQIFGEGVVGTGSGGMAGPLRAGPGPMPIRLVPDNGGGDGGGGGGQGGGKKTSGTRLPARRRSSLSELSSLLSSASTGLQNPATLLSLSSLARDADTERKERRRLDGGTADGQGQAAAGAQTAPITIGPGRRHMHAYSASYDSDRFSSASKLACSPPLRTCNALVRDSQFRRQTKHVRPVPLGTCPMPRRSLREPGAGRGPAMGAKGTMAKDVARGHDELFALEPLSVQTTGSAHRLS